MQRNSISLPIRNFVDIEFGYTDGSSDRWPSVSNKIEKRNTARQSVRYFKLPADDKRVSYWRSCIGDAIAQDKGFANPSKHVIKDFPEGYALFLKITGPLRDPRRTDVCLFGGPTVTMYRSPIAFKSHAIWIFGGGVGPCDCGCFHRRYDDVARQVKTILNTVEPITEDIKALPTVFDLIPIEIHTQAESLTFGPGEVVWVILTVPWTHLESSIDVWPGVIMSQDVSRYSVQLLPAYREHWILEENILPWASMTDIEKYTRSVSSIQTPSAATILMFNPVSSECVWTERVGMLVAAFNTAKTITDNISHFDIHTEGIQKTGIFLGAERIIPGHLVRLKLRRDDLSKYDNFRTTSETAYSNMKQNEDAHRATNNILYLSVEDIQFTESSRTYVLMGRLVELIEDYGDISEGVLLEDVVPPRGYRLCTVLEHGCGAAVSLHLVSGRYYPRIMYHSFFDYEPFENCMHLAVLEGLFLQRGDISHNTYRYNGTSRPHAITAALHKNI